MKRWVTCTAVWAMFGMMGCSVASEALSSEEAELASGTAYEYSCTNKDQTVLESTAFRIVVSKDQLLFQDAQGADEGLSGSRDSKYQPKGTSTIRYHRFNWGGDSAFEVQMDSSALSGASSIQLHALSTYEDEENEDLISCTNPKKVLLEPAKPSQPSSADTLKSARLWSCEHVAGLSEQTQVELKVSDQEIWIKGEFELRGARDLSYSPKSGDYIRFAEFVHGEDCEMTAVIEAKALKSESKEAVLKIRCAGEDFVQDAYSCKAP